MSIATVNLGRHRITRLIIGGNPFSGCSHQSRERDEEMLNYYTTDRIKQTLRECEAAGINTCLMRADAHILRVLREYRNEGGTIQWIAQQAGEQAFEGNLQRAVADGAIAYFVHGAVADQLYAEGKLGRITDMVACIKDAGIPAGVAGHALEVHRAVDQAGIAVDFHVVCFYNCGSIHAGRGNEFSTTDPPKAVNIIQEIQKPCIAYKVLGAGRVSAQEGLSYAFANIKPTDAVVVGMFTKDKPGMVEENVRLAERAISSTCDAP